MITEARLVASSRTRGKDGKGERKEKEGKEERKVEKLSDVFDLEESLTTGLGSLCIQNQDQCKRDKTSKP